MSKKKARSKENKTYTTFDVRVGGKVYTYKASYLSDGRLFFRPTLDDLEINPRLKPLKRKRLIDLIEDVAACFDDLSPDVIATHYFNDELWRFIKRKRFTKPTSQSDCYNTVRYYITPYFENKRIKNLTQEDYQYMLDSLYNNGYSKTVIDKAYLYVHQFLKDLLDAEVIKRDLLKNCHLYTDDEVKDKREELNKRNKERKYLKPDEIKKILETAYNGEFVQPEAIEFLIRTGLRCGELVGFKYSDWNKEEQTITIQRARGSYYTVDDDGAGHTVIVDKKPKNVSSRATIHISDKANYCLIRMHNKEKDNYKGYIVHTRDHKPISVRTMEDRVYRICIEAGYKETYVGKDGKEKTRSTISPHQFRHAAASIMFTETNNMVYVSKKLRHKDVATTQRIYAKLLEEKERELDAEIDKKLDF